jgi:hypothetical protein
MRWHGGFRRRTTALNAILIIAGLLTFTKQGYAKKQRQPTGVVISWKKVPAGVQATLEANTAAGKIKEVQTGTVNGFVFYCAEVKASDGKWTKVYVKEDGTLIRAELDNARNKRKHKPLFGG